jgi:transposase, IS30 family
MGKASHLSEKERDKISILHAEGKKPAQIAKIIGRHRSTITRELERNTAVFYRDKYIGSQSHKNIQRKWKESHKRKRLNPKIIEYIESKLKLGYSPEIISNTMEEDIGMSVSHEAIYQFIYKGRNDLTVFLTRRHLGRKKRKKGRKSKRTLIPNRIDIDKRPPEANERKEFGHFEGDTIFSKNSLSALLVIVDRLTRRSKIRKLTRKTASQASSQIVFALKDYNIFDLKTITYDNGSEFCYHEKVNEELKMDSYFCKPYHAWEKGTVENINGLIRRFFPKGTDFDTITEEQIQYVEDWINNRPMKCLGFKSPNQKAFELNVAIAC